MSDGCSCCDMRTVAAAGGGRDSRTRSDGRAGGLSNFCTEKFPSPLPHTAQPNVQYLPKAKMRLVRKKRGEERMEMFFSAVENFFFSFFRLPPMGGCYGRIWEKEENEEQEKNRRRRTTEQRRSRAINFNTGKGEGTLPFPIPFFPWPSVNYFFSLLRPSSSSR